MAAAKSARKKRRIEKALIEQLKLRGADTPYFLDKVDEYMQLWNMVDEMQQDINTRGLHYSAISAAGKEYVKTNEFVKLIPGYVKQMQAILDALDLKVDNVASPAGDDDDEGL